MKLRLLLSILVLAVVISSCSTSYKNGQTPDDVYYSPAQERSGYIETRKREPYVRQYDSEERQLRMRYRDYRWRTLDYDYDYGYRYNPYNYGYNYGYYYNPYYYPVPVYNYGCAVVNPKSNIPRMTNLSSYNTVPVVKNTKTGTRTTNVNSTAIFSGRNNGNGNQTYSRRILRSDANSEGYSPSRQQNNNRSYNPSSSSSSSGSRSSSSGGTSVSRPSRGN